MSDETPKPPDQSGEAPAKPIVTGRQNEPCGCIVTSYSNDTEMTTPCLGHGLKEVSSALSHAAGVLNVMGNVAVQAQQQQAMLEIAHNLDQVGKNIGGKGSGPQGIVTP